MRYRADRDRRLKTGKAIKDIDVTDHKDAHRARAEAQFKKPEAPATEATEAKAQRDAETAAREANTERLKRLRLAKEESTREAIATNKAKRTLKGR